MTILVSVGTDYHPFDRLIGWVDGWLSSRAEAGADPIEVVVQHGTSEPPNRAKGVAFLDHAELDDLMAHAQAVVCHGGPSTIAEARRHAHRPIVVPRSPRHGEHVDDHQQRFSRRLADKGLVRLVSTEAELAVALEEALAAPTTAPVAAQAPEGQVTPPEGSAGYTASEAAVRFGELVDAMLAKRAARRR